MSPLVVHTLLLAYVEPTGLVLNIWVASSHVSAAGHPVQAGRVGRRYIAGVALPRESTNWGR